MAAGLACWTVAAVAGLCRSVIPDEEVRCPYHALDPARHNVVFVDLSDDSLRAADVSRADRPSSDLIFDPLLPDAGWAGLATFVSPDLQRAIVMRTKPDCPPFDGRPEGPGLRCSYGRVTLWLAYHDRVTNEWVHVNLAARGLGLNSEAHGWSTWLQRDMVLFNALTFPDDGGFHTTPEENNAQIYAVRFQTGGNDFVIEPFAPDQLWRSDCLTGRVNAQPPRAQDRCFDGQRVSFVRRCYSEPSTPSSHAWWNTVKADGSGGSCRSDSGSFNVPVLRTYVMELDGNCRPKVPFESMTPAHEPSSDPLNRQMGSTPEWGDMLSAISPDGDFLAFATNTGDPRTPEDNCAGFRLNLNDPADPLSGQSNRITHVCRLDANLRCGSDPVRLPTTLTPPESTLLPAFVSLQPDGVTTQYVVLSRRWSQTGSAPLDDVVRYDFSSSLSLVPLAFGSNAVAILPVVFVAPAGIGRRRAVRHDHE